MNKELQVRVSSVVDTANKYDIISNEVYEQAAEFMKTQKALRKQIDGSFDPIIEAAFKSHREAIKQKKIFTDPLDQAEKLIKIKISGWLVECEKKRQEDQLRLEALAKKEAEERALLEAQHAESPQEAEAIIQEAIETAPVVVAPRVESKIEGISSRKVWKWRIKNIHLVNRNFTMLDETKINQVVKSMGKDAATVVGGIECFEETVIAARV